MTRRKWTTDVQGNWLATHLDAFAEAQSKKTTKDFFQKIIKEWHEAFPVPDPTPEEVTKGKNREEIIKKKKNKEENVREYSFQILVTRQRRLTGSTACQGVVPQSYSRADVRVRQSWFAQAPCKTKGDTPRMANLSADDIRV